jgi:hypothetical protein
MDNRNSLPSSVLTRLGSISRIVKHLRCRAMALGLALVFGGVSANANTVTWTFQDAPLGDVGSSTHAYTTIASGNPYTITAHGYLTGTNNSPTFSGANSVSIGALSPTWTPPTSAVNLYEKNAGAGEQGLGLTGLANSEIQKNSFISLDVSQLWSKGFTSLQLNIGSIQLQEGFYLFGDDGTNAANPGTMIFQYRNSASTPVVLSLPLITHHYNHLSIAGITQPSTVIVGGPHDGEKVPGGPNADILLCSISGVFTPVPPSVTPLPTGASAGLALLGVFAFIQVRRDRRTPVALG